MTPEIASYLEAAVAVIEILILLIVACLMVKGLLWMVDQHFASRRGLYPSTHVAGDDDEQIDFDEALRSLDRWDR